MQRILLLVVVLFALGAVPAAAGTSALPSPGCQAINSWDIPFNDEVDEGDINNFPEGTTFEVVEGTSFFSGEVVTVVGTGGIFVPVALVGYAVQYFNDPDTAVFAGDAFAIAYEFNGDETAFAGAAFYYAEGVAVCQPAPDADGDGIGDDSDACPDTNMLLEGSGDLKNRYRVSGPGGDFVDVDGNSAGVSIYDTDGCSAADIGDALGLGKGHTKFGISSSALDLWLAR